MASHGLTVFADTSMQQRFSLAVSFNFNSLMDFQPE